VIRKPMVLQPLLVDTPMPKPLVSPTSQPRWAPPEQSAPAPELVPDDQTILAVSSIEASDDGMDDIDDQTVFASRLAKTRWYLGQGEHRFELTAEKVLLGRKPGANPDATTQVIELPDATRTISKRHATLHRNDEEWTIIDLASTNGVTLIYPDETEESAVPKMPVPLTERFYLGDVEYTLISEVGLK